MSDEQRAALHRRSCDEHNGDGHATPCNNLMVHTALEEELRVSMAALMAQSLKNSEALESMLEIIKAWENTKGFITTMKAFGKFIFFLMAVIAAFSAFGEIFKHWITKP